VECSALLACDIAMDQEWMRTRRGWTEQEWAAGLDRLSARGLVTPEGAVTPAGRALRAEVERTTDALADGAWTALGDARAERLAALVAPLVRTITTGDSFLRDNPMGLRPLPEPAPTA
jgi:Helix-turn-helix family